MQNFGGKTKSIMVFLKKAYVHCGATNHSPFPRFQELIVGNLNMIVTELCKCPFAVCSWRKYCQIPINMDIGGRENGGCLCHGGVCTCIKWVMLLKSKIQVLFEKHTKETKGDVSIVKLNISYLHKAIIMWNKSMDTQKSLVYILYFLLKTVLCMQYYIIL